MSDSLIIHPQGTHTPKTIQNWLSRMAYPEGSWSEHNHLTTTSKLKTCYITMIFRQEIL
ncbi:hypothetical protein SERLA73DRAFT_185165 [Serpula lacrymans var. lacrymans S7.3]|uniref:Uncharacterized protein n=1 Tax=Serpula lacrymans var. lacrymans (strain S7.3) TaxID=936435 RepID=F8Q467_SERL3|nr:hypothetical protein SERLA73DRAFT_185165 [Serpula lacrymans var. lacrymans S7.3]